MTEFLYEILIQIPAQDIKVNTDYPSLNKNDIDNIKIPLPPLEVQKQIIAECEKIDQEYETSRMAIQDYRKRISEIFENLGAIENRGGGETLKISELCLLNPSKLEIKDIPNTTLVSFVEMASVSND